MRLHHASLRLQWRGCVPGRSPPSLSIRRLIFSERCRLPPEFVWRRAPRPASCGTCSHRSRFVPWRDVYIARSLGTPSVRGHVYCKSQIIHTPAIGISLVNLEEDSVTRFCPNASTTPFPHATGSGGAAIPSRFDGTHVHPLAE